MATPVDYVEVWATEPTDAPAYYSVCLVHDAERALYVRVYLSRHDDRAAAETAAAKESRDRGIPVID